MKHTMPPGPRGKGIAAPCHPAVLTRRHWLLQSGWGALATWLGASPPAIAQELTDLAKVRASGTLKIALYKDNAPYSDGAGQAMQGVDVALAQALAQTLGLRLQLLPFDAGERMDDDLRNMVWRGHYLGYGPADVMLHVPVDKYLIQTNPQVLIFAPYAREQLVVLHALDKLPQVRGPEDLVGQALAAERGSGAASSLMGYGGGRLREQVRISASGIEAAQAVVRGEVSAAYVSRAQAETALHPVPKGKPGFALTSLTLPDLSDHGWAIGMAVKASHTGLAQALQNALDTLRQNGQLQAMYKHQGLTLISP